MRTITAYEIEHIGIDYPDYFPGRGISNTPWEDVAIGTGDNAYDALDDALEQLAQRDWETDTEEMERESDTALEDGLSVQDAIETNGISDDAQYYVAVYVKETPSENPLHDLRKF